MTKSPFSHIHKKRTSAKVVRETRDAAKKHNSRSARYRRIDKWEEDGIGTDNERYTLTLKKGWSFTEFDHDNKKGFKSVSEAMRGVNMTYPCRCFDCTNEKEVNK